VLAAVSQRAGSIRPTLHSSEQREVMVSSSPSAVSPGLDPALCPCVALQKGYEEAASSVLRAARGLQILLKDPLLLI